ncbi:hypothetical protein GGI20_003327 [Coemansia sp. BCRC 34301]|nr:hypothetical protein GGI20_003327 [Coemansia sp. BCRC 34301]
MPFATRNGQQRPGALNDTRNFAQLSHFIYLFRAALSIEDFCVEQLEDELGLADQDDNCGQPLIRQILKRVLRILTGNRSIDESRLDAYIARAWQKYMDGTGRELSPAFGELGLLGLGSGDRTRVVLEICEMIMCRPDNLRAVASVASTDPLEYRVEPVGVDDVRRKYWLLCGTRLYRETPKAIADLLLAAEDEASKVEEHSKEKSNGAQAGEEDDPEQNQSNGDMELRRRSTRITVQKSKPAVRPASPAARQQKPSARLPSKEAVSLADPPRHCMREQDGDLWELLCTDAGEWTDIPKLFCQAKSKAERSLFKALSESGAQISHELSAAARQRQMQAALTIRKRSSRIAMLESKHEFDMRQLAEAAALASYSDDSGGRRQSKRLRSYVDYSCSSDDSHTLPLARTRDLRAQRREQARLAALDHEEVEQAIRCVDESEYPPTSAKTLTHSAPETDLPDPGTDDVQMEDEDWMFSCACGKTGLNYDDGRTMTACESCSVWRHLGCALRAEAQRIGHAIEEDDWDSIYYVCPECRAKQNQAASALQE